MQIAAVAAATWTVAFSLGAQTITVYVRNDASVAASELCQAKSNAARIFASAEVGIQWRKGAPRPIAPEEQRPIVVLIVSDMSSVHPGALAFAQAYEGIHVTILYERVKAFKSERPQVILTYVLVHEITHMLQGISRHSETGIMKAHWNWVDHYAMGRGRLLLSAEDIELIHLGLAARTSRLLTAGYRPPAAR
jgi:hypothetical protein